MNMTKKITGLLLACVLMSACNNKTGTGGLLVIREQGSFAVGGTVVHSGGQTFHGDHAYVFYQKPADERRLPLVFLHGTMQFSKTWETTPDGREGCAVRQNRRRHLRNPFAGWRHRLV
jgi:hypothetical protein